MKKLFLLAVVVFGGLGISNAQVVEAPQIAETVGSTPIQKGNWLVGAGITNLGYSFEGDAFSFGVTPRAGYFLSDGIAVGASVEVGGVFQKGHKPAWTYGIMPFVRYYFPEGASATGRFFAQGDIGFKGATRSGKSDNGFAFGANVGYAHFVTSSVALEATFGYNYSDAVSTIGDGAKQSGLGLGLGFQIYIPSSKN